jgi:NDP-sugar pyrophosphorylase family protein
MAAQIVILAGGLGTRMQDHFPDIPKALIPIQGKTFLQHQLELLQKNGVTQVLLITGHLSSAIEDFVSKLKIPGLNVQVFNEGPLRRGTGGALRFALDQGALSENFFLLYGDSYLPVDYAQIWKEYLSAGRPLLMSVFKNKNQLEKGNVEFDARKKQVILYDKFQTLKKSAELEYVDYGLSAFAKSVITQIPSDTAYDLSQLYHELSLKDQVAGHEVFTRFYEVGSPLGLRDFNEFLNSTKDKL